VADTRRGGGARADWRGGHCGEKAEAAEGIDAARGSRARRPRRAVGRDAHCASADNGQCAVGKQTEINKGSQQDGKCKKARIPQLRYPRFFLPATNAY
jgi:hypothetical protein